MLVFLSILNNSHSRVTPSFCFKARLSAKLLLIGNDFYSHANKPNFHKKGLVLSLVLKVRLLELENGPLYQLKAAVNIHTNQVKQQYFHVV